MCVCVCVCVCVHACVLSKILKLGHHAYLDVSERERERERENSLLL